MVVPFSGSLDRRAPFVVVSSTFGALVEGPAVVGSADD